MREHSANAEVIAKYLSEHDSVERVIYPSVMDGYAKERAEKYLTRGNGGLMGFEIKGGRESGEKFINALINFSPDSLPPLISKPIRPPLPRVRYFSALSFA